MTRWVAGLLALALSSCSHQVADPEATQPLSPAPVVPWKPGWSRDAVCYEVFVRSFQDSNGDGIGDLNGLRARLDHINDGDPGSGSDLGATCIWLMPVASSPSYHGYDVADYLHIDAEYGTDADFRALIAEAHRRGIRVLVDLVLNHASSQHPYFRQALSDPSSPYRRWFRFASTHPGVRNPWGGDNWHRSPVRDEYYYGFFWSGMPDLDHTYAPVRAWTRAVATHWLRDMGVDGFRLDAVSFLVEEGHDRVQHTAGTHAVLRDFGSYVRRTAPDAFTIGEVWDSTAAVSSYYPEQLDAYFAFQVSDAIIASARSGTAQQILDAVAQAVTRLPDQRWAPFLRNHDQERTLTALGGEVARARVAATVLLTLPGTPFLYYGEEIGMSGPKDGAPEADMGVRTPMQWSADPNAGFTTGAPWYAPRADWRTVNVAAQTADSSSLLAHHRRLIRLRTTTPALTAGDWVPLAASDPGVVAYLRRANGSTVLVVVNLGADPRSRVALSSSGAALGAGSYTPRALLGDTPAAVQIGADGVLRSYVPFETLPPFSSQVMAF